MEGQGKISQGAGRDLGGGGGSTRSRHNELQFLFHFDLALLYRVDPSRSYYFGFLSPDHNGIGDYGNYQDRSISRRASCKPTDTGEY